MNKQEKTEDYPKMVFKEFDNDPEGEYWMTFSGPSALRQAIRTWVEANYSESLEDVLDKIDKEIDEQLVDSLLLSMGLVDQPDNKTTG